MAPEDESPKEFPKPFPTDDLPGGPREVIPPPPESAELEACHDLLREALNLPRLSDDKLREFVDDFVSNRIFTSAHLRDQEANLLPMIFMPLGLGALSSLQPDSLSQVGCLWEYLDKAGPRAINGRPMFFSFQMLHIDDWERAKAAITKEQERRKNIEL